MKQRILLSIILVAALFTACVKSSFEDKAKERLEESVSRKIPNPYYDFSCTIVEQNTVYSSDSACVIQYVAYVKDVYGREAYVTMEYSLVWSLQNTVCESSYSIKGETAVTPVLERLKEIRGGKTVENESKAEYDRAVRSLCATYSISYGKTVQLDE